MTEEKKKGLSAEGVDDPMSKSIVSNNNNSGNGNGVKKAKEVFKILMMFLPSLDQLKRSSTLQWSETWRHGIYFDKDFSFIKRIIMSVFTIQNLFIPNSTQELIIVRREIQTGNYKRKIPFN